MPIERTCACCLGEGRARAARDTYLVARFKSAIVIALLLHGVVRQMNHAVRRVFQVVLPAASPQIPVRVPVRLQVAVDGRAEGVAPDVELPVLVQERLLNVFLNDVAASVAVHLLRLDQALDVLQVATHLDTTASIRVLARLHNPELVAVLGVLSEHLVVLRIVIRFLELEEFAICFALFDVEGQRYPIKRILPHGLVIDLHVVVDGLFVAQMEVVLLMVRRDHVMARVVLFLLLLLIVIVFAFAIVGVRSSSDLLQGLVAGRGYARVGLFEGGKSLLLGPLRRCDQIFDG